MVKKIYVGMDVHKDTVSAAVFRNHEKETYNFIKMKNDIPEIFRFFENLKKQGIVKTCYEAGCTGFYLQRKLKDIDIKCEIVAPGKIPRKSGDRVKTDRRDAEMLGRLLQNQDVKGIYVPTSQDEAVRDYLRAREDLSQDMQKNRQRLSKFLLRNGQIYRDGKQWSMKHEKWLKSLAFNAEEPAKKGTFDLYFQKVISLQNELAVLDQSIVEIAQSPVYRERVNRLRCFRGIDYLTALNLIIEIGDFDRFDSAAHFMSFLGIIPGEHSSGNRRHLTGITKVGNSRIRRLLIESSWHYRHRPTASKRLLERRKDQPAELCAYADKAAQRLNQKFQKLLQKGTIKQKAITAVARELAGFVWGTMNEQWA